MHRNNLYIYILLLLLSVNLAGQTTERINFKWLYHRGDLADAHQIRFDDEEWRIIKLPHDGSISDTVPEKVGWYRKHIELFGNLNKRKIYIEFEGVIGSYDFWVNNQKLESQKNGLKRVIFDVTPFMQPGENVIALRYEKSAEVSALIDGEGIFRDALVHFNNLLHIGHEGISISASVISAEKAHLNIKSDVLNNRDIATPCKISVSITDPSGKLVAEKSDSTIIGSGKRFRFENVFKLDKPYLWCFENHSLYKAKIKIADARGVVDLHEESFPIRQVEFPAKETVSFNGTEFNLRGVTLHPVYGPLGAAEHHRAVERRLESIRDLGFNAIHINPLLQSSHINHWCNENGMIVLNENAEAPDQRDFLDPVGFPIEEAVKNGKSYMITLEADRKYIASDGFDLCYITATITDSEGNCVTDADRIVSFKVKGAAENIGVGNGDISSREPSQANERSAYKGKVLLVLRSNQKKGEIEIKAKAKGLKPALLIVQAI